MTPSGLSGDPHRPIAELKAVKLALFPARSKPSGLHDNLKPMNPARCVPAPWPGPVSQILFMVIQSKTPSRKAEGVSILR